MFLTKRFDLKSKKHRRRLLLESLESRAMMAAVAAPSGLVSWYTANSNGTDATGLNQATLLNGTSVAGGKVGNAFSFDGVNDRVDLGDPDSLKFNASMSIEGWVFARTNTPNFGSIVFRGDDRGGLDPYSLVVLQDGTLRFEVDGGNGAADLTAPMPLGQFTHLAATLDDATGAMKLYINGAVVAQQVTAIRPFRDLTPTLHPGIGIGNANSTYNVPFNGLIDELSMYNRGLTEGEVLGIYKAGSEGKVFSPVVTNSSSALEGANGATTPITFTVQRTGSLTEALVVNWTTADDTATAGADYVAASGQITFLDGEATKTVEVIINGDGAVESNETFKLILTPAGGTSVMTLGTIVTDDVSVAIGNAVVTEGTQTLTVLDRFVTEGSGGLLSATRQSIFGPDGNLYVAAGLNNAILRYNGVTGAFMDTFVATGSGGLNSPTDVAFGPDGNIYVSSTMGNQVLKYDGSTGAFLGVVVGGLSNPIGITFGRDGSLYIANQDKNEVLRYKNGVLSPFVSAGSGGLNQPRQGVFGPDGNFYVASQGTGQVLRYNGSTGAFLSVFTTAVSTQGVGPIWLEFGTDGLLYTTARTEATGNNTSINRFSSSTGVIVDSSPLGRPGWSFIVGPGNIVYDSSNGLGAFIDRLVPVLQVAFTVSLNITSLDPITVNYTTVNGTASAGSDYSATTSSVTFAPGETSKTIVVQTIDDSIIELPETFSVVLSSAVGATIIGSPGTGTIADNDTKFYVVDDATANRTFEYGSGTGTAGENYALNTGNTTPRGVASTAAGEKVWVVDANRNVYVYNTSGAVLGSWTAGSMSTTAQPEGITTNGTDVWIVDNKNDQVFKYAGAASRLSGSQTAVSTFNLNSSNTSPKDLVTDGTSIWVVNDSSTDKVFKYTIGGTLLGSWTMNSGGGSPTGITLDPSNASQNLWIVDSNSDSVYEYPNARSLVSGSQTSSVTFALASGNANAQGIADPPVGTVRPASPADSNATMSLKLEKMFSTVMVAPVIPANSDLRVTNISDVQRPDHSEAINVVLGSSGQASTPIEQSSRQMFLVSKGSVEKKFSSHDSALLDVMDEDSSDCLRIFS